MNENIEKCQFLDQFSKFNDEMGGKGELWRYWNIFLDKIMPVVINLTKSFRNGDWELHMTSHAPDLCIWANKLLSVASIVLRRLHEVRN